MVRAEIVVHGVVQGVGFRYFVQKQAQKLGIVGWTKNLPSGAVQTVVEGSQEEVETLYRLLQVGPAGARVEEHSLVWQRATAEFVAFDIRR